MIITRCDLKSKHKKDFEMICNAKVNEKLGNEFFFKRSPYINNFNNDLSS